MYPYRKIKSVISHVCEWNVLHGFRQKNIITPWKNGSPHMPEQCSLPVRGNINTVMRDINCCKITVQLIGLYMGGFSSMQWNYWIWELLWDTICFSDAFYLPQVDFHLQKPTVWNRYGQDTKSKLQHNDWQYNTVHRIWLKWKAVTYIQGSLSWNSLVRTVNAYCSEQEVSLTTET